jgi:hypothetical protein
MFLNTLFLLGPIAHARGHVFVVCCIHHPIDSKPRASATTATGASVRAAAPRRARAATRR